MAWSNEMRIQVNSGSSKLLKAFIEEAQDRGFEDTTPFKDPFQSAVFYEWGKFRKLGPGQVEEVDRQFYLPVNWNTGIAMLERMMKTYKQKQRQKTELKIGKWYQIEHKGQLYIRQYEGTIPNAHQFEEFHIGRSESISKASDDQIAEELMRRKGLKVGDHVRFKASLQNMGRVEEGTIIKIEDYKLGKPGATHFLSEYCKKWAQNQATPSPFLILQEHGAREVPADDVEKIVPASFKIETAEDDGINKHRPYSRANGVTTGCLEWSLEDLQAIENLQGLCHGAGIQMSFDENGDITWFSDPTSKVSLHGTICVSQVRELIDHIKNLHDNGHSG